MVSIVIRSKNEEKYIGGVLEGILSQKLKPKEIVVIDSGSKDHTLLIARQYGVKILEIPAEKFTYGYALNYGINTLTTPYVISLSAHATPATDEWLQALFESINSSEDIAAVVGKEIPYEGCNTWEKRRIMQRYPPKPVCLGTGNRLTLSNANTIFRKPVWQRIRFNEKIEFGEDLLWQREVLAHGYRALYCPIAAVYHSHDLNLRGFYTRQKRIALAERRYKPLRLNGYIKFVLYDLIENLHKDAVFSIKNSDNLTDSIINTLFTKRVLLYAARLKQITF